MNARRALPFDSSRRNDALRSIPARGNESVEQAPEMGAIPAKRARQFTVYFSRLVAEKARRAQPPEPLGDPRLRLSALAQSALHYICAEFPELSRHRVWLSQIDDYGVGQAIDIMVNGDQGWNIANWLVSNATQLNVEYVLYEQSIWGRWAPGAGFMKMEDRGSDTDNYFDHVHVTFR